MDGVRIDWDPISFLAFSLIPWVFGLGSGLLWGGNITPRDLWNWFTEDLRKRNVSFEKEENDGYGATAGI
ncbi:MAG: hypothetical protein ACLFUR_06160 [Candidatus Hadarchaeia archaeon]